MKRGTEWTNYRVCHPRFVYRPFPCEQNKNKLSHYGSEIDKA